MKFHPIKYMEVNSAVVSPYFFKEIIKCAIWSAADILKRDLKSYRKYTYCFCHIYCISFSHGKNILMTLVILIEMFK